MGQDHAEEKDQTDEVLRKCEEIAKQLRKQLGGSIKDGDRCGAGVWRCYRRDVDELVAGWGCQCSFDLLNSVCGCVMRAFRCNPSVGGDARG